MTRFDDVLQQAFDDLAATAPHRPDLERVVRRRSRHRRAIAAAPALVAAVVVAVVAAQFAFRSHTGNLPAAAPPSACSPIPTIELPPWARAGFSDPQPRMPAVYSRSGTMLAIVFASPLRSPQRPGAGNKILWVTDEPAGPGQPLVVTGRLENGDAVSHSTVDGAPGPSYVDVPVAGCWLFDLSWGTHRDVIALPYAAP